MSFRTKNGRLVVVNQDSPLHNKSYAAKAFAEDRKMLEWGEANELFTGYVTLRPKENRNKWLVSRLEKAERLYGPGSADRIRKYMGGIREFWNWKPD